MCEGVCVCESVRMWVSVCVCLCACLCALVCVCVCVRACHFVHLCHFECLPARVWLFELPLIIAHHRPACACTAMMSASAWNA